MPPRLPRAHLRENVAAAADALRANRLRSGLTILGVVIGVATVMTMGALVAGLRRQIVSSIEVAGPTTFYVLKKFSQTPLNPDALPRDVRIRPDLTRREAALVAALPEVSYAALWGQVLARLEYRGTRTQPLAVFGADERFPEIQGGGLTTGRWFNRAELRSGAPVVVLDEGVAARLLGREYPLGRVVRVGGRPLEVIGLYAPPDNIFSPPGAETGAIVPFELLDRQYPIDKTNALWIPVKPAAGTVVEDAEAAVAIALREHRRLRPGDGATFDLVTQDQILGTFNSLTSVFFLVMIALSSVALLVGGIGVMAMMMVSVTARTREIGVRKAVGATRQDILVQFLVEAGTLTGVGGVLGLALGLGGARAVGAALSVPASAPLGSAVAAIVASVAIGVVFGLLPARRAARLDPVDALRHE